MVQRTVLKVQLSCEKCKKKMLKSISGIQGVDKIEIDAAKDTVAVTGDGDPYEIIVQARKAVKCGVEVVTIGPPPKKPDEKKPDEKKQGDEKSKDKGCTCTFPPPYIHFPQSCLACRQVAVVHMNPEPCTTCSIM